MKFQDLRISSAQNPRLKAAVALTKQRERQKTGLFLIEGAREIERALLAHYEVTQGFYCQEALSPAGYAVLGGLRGQLLPPPLIEVSPEAFARLAMREGSDGLAVVAKQKQISLKDLSLTSQPLILAVEAVEKPGNLGALLRTADGAGVDAVIVLEPTVDIYNANVIRASLGTVFRVPVVSAALSEFKQFCQKNALSVFAAALHEQAVAYHTLDYRRGSVMLLGSEAHGLTAELVEGADHVIKIPMLGLADSLNVAVAGAILLYEARRQRMIG